MNKQNKGLTDCGIIFTDFTEELRLNMMHKQKNFKQESHFLSLPLFWFGCVDCWRAYTISEPRLYLFEIVWEHIFLFSVCSAIESVQLIFGRYTFKNVLNNEIK